VKSSIFEIVSCSSSKANRRFRRTCRPNFQGRKRCGARRQDEAGSNCHLLAKWFSETSVDLQRTLRRYIPEDKILHAHRCQNLKSYVTNFIGKLEDGILLGRPICILEESIENFEERGYEGVN
jgi:hypothetical protein